MTKRLGAKPYSNSVSSRGTDFHFIPWYDIYSSHIHCDDESPTFGTMRASSPSCVSHPPSALCPCDRWLYPAMLNHNWILLLPSRASMPRRLMEFEWVLQQKWNVIHTCMNDVYKSSPAVPRRAGITPQICPLVENEQHNSLSLWMHHCFLCCLFVDACG